MSGKIESKQDSQRSHLSSFTMKLMDKFHSPKIKRTPSKKGKQLQPEPAVKTTEKPVNKKVSRLEEHEKEVVSALRYFKTIVDKMVVDKKVLEMLPGSASKVLEAILPLVQVEPRIQHSSAVSSCHNRVYQSLANLIRWSDQVMLEGVNLEDKETISMVTTVIKAVLDGVKELVKLTIEKQDHPSPTSPAKPVPPVAKPESTADLPLSEREKEILSKTTPKAQSAEAHPDAADEDVAPPKPPLPGVKIPEFSPPALPPKKRQSAPSPTRVAVVAPMSRTTSGMSLPIGINKQDCETEFPQRRFSGGSHSYGGESPRLSPCNSMGKLSKSDEQLSSLEQDSGQCSRNTSCETLDNTESYDPDYDFLHQDLSSMEHMPPVQGGCLSPLPESHSESSSPCPGQQVPHPRFSAPCPQQPPEYWTAAGLALPSKPSRISAPPALPQKKRRSTASQPALFPVFYERLPSHYDNISEEDLQAEPPFPLFTPLPQSNGGAFAAEFLASDSADLPESPPPLPEKKSRHILQYMQFVEDYSEPQPSVFYQTPQSESIYEQRNKRFQEVYGFNDSFSSTDSVHEPLPPPALPPKQRQLASHSASPSSSSSSSLSCHLQHSAVGAEEASAALSLSLSVSNSFLSGHASLATPTSSDLVVPANASQLADPGGVANGSLESSGGSFAVCLPSESSLTDSLQPSVSESANEEGGEGEYVNLYSSSQANGELLRSHGDLTTANDDVIQDPGPQNASSNSKETSDVETRRQKSTDSGQSDEEVDELSLIDHKEIMSRLTLKQENDDGPDVRAGSGDILLVHATETDRKDLVLYCEAFLTTYRTFITPEDLIKKLHYRYTRFCHSPDVFKKRVSKNTFFVLVRVVDELCLVELTDDILKQLMDLVFRLVCNGELSLARVLRKNILDKVEQKKLLRYTNSLKPLAARGVAARPGTLHDFRSHEVADQLTLLDAELFYKIEIPEVLLWAKEQNEEKSPNLTQFTEHFNNMSYWVRSIIIQQEKAQDREKLLLKFIKIMKHLRKLNNFNSYLAILSALDSAPIRRLEWQKQTSEGLEEYCTLIDSSSSFRAYRAALADVEPPCIPYLGLILQDLTFVHLGNPDLIDGKVNFSKRWQQFNILDSMRRFQQVHYELKRNDDIVSFFNDFSDHLAEEALWELSLKIKPRNITRRKTEREEKT
ncbi:rap guanine nucleotide exchange factor 1b isoform X3 [Anguilla anguilla]|uniref:rap guanine nucleotide exchange factor 1b isoform X3 n=1 Tax=Anguilla anguilla TaxID=7936 RepID=UPI0015B0053E|nr:rap guanine nucleotide exchange factor 1b isoform X3 [Anguilla anguilla]